MSDDINFKNNPLHGLGLKQLLNELVDHYGFEILHAYLSINCFDKNPSIESSIKFLKKTEWAREKVEGFYLYQYKSLPRASKSQYELAPRDRIIPEGQVPKEPAELSLEDAERLREKRALRSKGGATKRAPKNKTARDYADSRIKNRENKRPASKPEQNNDSGSFDPWANARNKKN